MSRGERSVLIGTILVVLLILVLENMAARAPNWRDSFSAYKREPFGCALVHERLSDLFPKGVTIVHDPIYTTAQERSALDNLAPRVNHIFVDNWMRWDHLDLEHLLKMVRDGDDAFIALKNWGEGGLLDTLGIGMSDRYAPYSHDRRILWNGTLNPLVSDDTTRIRFTCWPLVQQEEYPFRRGDFDGVFANFPLTTTQVLASKTVFDSAAGDQRFPVLVRTQWGKGHIYLCSAPHAFTNYALLDPATKGFMESAFSLLPDRPVLWDEFYKVGRLESQTPLRFVLSTTPLKRAYWTMIILLLLTIFVHARRRQRAIPELVPLRNTSKEFAETIGRLYFFKGDHAGLARKMCLFFKDELRQRLHLRRAVWDEETIEHVAMRTNIPVDEWKSLFRLFSHYESTPYVSQDQLMQLNKTISLMRARL
jgi:hypothetical protein